MAALTSEEIFLYHSRFYFKNVSTSLYHKFTDDGMNIHRSLRMLITNPFVPRVKQVTKRLVEAGIVDKLVDSFVDPSGWMRGVTMGKSSICDYVSLSMFHMVSPFMYLICGYILSIAVFILEVFSPLIYYNLK